VLRQVRTNVRTNWRAKLIERQQTTSGRLAERSAKNTLYSASPQEDLKDVTEEFYAQLARTELHFTIAREEFDKMDFTDDVARYMSKLWYFSLMVGTNAQFDIKQPGKGFSRVEIGFYAKFEGKVHRYDDFGNINFGYAAKIFGIVLGDALMGAGINQMMNGDFHLNNPIGFFDDPQDSQMIEFGFNYLAPWPVVQGKKD